MTCRSRRGRLEWYAPCFQVRREEDGWVRPGGREMNTNSRLARRSSVSMGILLAGSSVLVQGCSPLDVIGSLVSGGRVASPATRPSRLLDDSPAPGSWSSPHRGSSGELGSGGPTGESPRWTSRASGPGTTDSDELGSGGPTGERSRPTPRASGPGTTDSGEPAGARREPRSSPLASAQDGPIRQPRLRDPVRASSGGSTAAPLPPPRPHDLPGASPEEAPASRRLVEKQDADLSPSSAVG